MAKGPMEWGFKSLTGIGTLFGIIGVLLFIIAFLAGWTIIWNFGTFVKILVFVIGLWVANKFIFNGGK